MHRREREELRQSGNRDPIPHRAMSEFKDNPYIYRVGATIWLAFGALTVLSMTPRLTKLFSLHCWRLHACPRG